MAASELFYNICDEWMEEAEASTKFADGFEDLDVSALFAAE